MEKILFEETSRDLLAGVSGDSVPSLQDLVFVGKTFGVRFAPISANHSHPETLPGSAFISQSEAGAGEARTNGSGGSLAAAERREEQAPSPDSTQAREPGDASSLIREGEAFKKYFMTLDECQLSLREVDTSYSSQGGGYTWHQPGFESQNNV